MKKRVNPFSSVNLTVEKPEAEVIFEIAAGVFIRAKYNLSEKPGWLSRGTIGIWDPATCRFKQQVQDGTHDFKNAMVADLIVRQPEKGESQSEAIERTTREAAAKLYSKFRPLIFTAILDEKDLLNHSLGQALELYGAEYITDCSVSAGMRKTRFNQLQNLANFFGEKPLKDIKLKDLKQFTKIHKGENSTEYLLNLQKFLTETAFRIGVEPPCHDVFKAFFQSAKKGKSKCNTDSNITADVLPEAYENKVDEGCWSNLGDPLWGAIVVGKEGGLDVKTLCSLKIRDILLTDTPEEVYVLYHRYGSASYTNDYSFALSPFGASYISAYLAALNKTCSPERIEGDKFLFAKDSAGKVPLIPEEVNSFIRKDLSRYVFGYTGVVALGNGTTIRLGFPLLRNTRKKHLLEDIRFDGDRNAILFLLHQSLRRSVQADNYRCFTDTYGRRLLQKRLAQDRHGCRPPSTPKEYKRMSQAIRGGNRELRFPPKHNSCPGQDQIITLKLTGLKPGDMIEIVGHDGCYAWFD